MTCVLPLLLALPAAAAPLQEEPALRLRPERTVAPAEPAVLPMQSRGPLAAVEVLVDGRGPYLFGIDTGGQGAARVDDDLVRELGLEPVGTVVGGDPTGRAGVEMPVYELASLALGGARFEGVRAASRDYDAAGLGHVDGILGWHLFEELVLTLDFAGRRVVVEAGPFEPPPGARPAAIVGDPDLPPRVAIARDGEPLTDAYVDTGKTGGILLPEALLEGLPLAGDPVVVGRARAITGEFEIRRATLAGELDVAGLRVAGLAVETGAPMPDAVVGSGFFDGRVVTFDPAGRRVWLREADDEARRALLRHRPASTRVEGPVAVAVEAVQGRPWVTVTLDGRGPYRLLFDTGSPGTLLDDDVVRALGLEDLGPTELTAPTGGTPVAARRHLIPHLELGAAAFEELPCTSMDLGALFGPTDAPDGILGLATFADVLLALDLRGGELRVEPGRLPPPDGASVLALRPDEHELPRLAIEVAGRAIDAHLDTGNPGGLLLPAAFAADLPTDGEARLVGRGRTISGSFDVFAATLDGPVAIGSARLEGPAFRFHEGLPVANLGGALLGGWRVEIDLGGWRLRFAPRD